MRRILITGSRDWTDETAVHTLILAEAFNLPPGEVVVIHGDCTTGADVIADAFARKQGYTVEAYPADWSQGRKAGPLRNQHMVDLGADICLAFPLPGSRGTLGCMKMAHRAGISLRVWSTTHDRDR